MYVFLSPHFQLRTNGTRDLDARQNNEPSLLGFGSLGFGGAGKGLLFRAVFEYCTSSLCKEESSSYFIVSCSHTLVVVWFLTRVTFAEN